MIRHVTCHCSIRVRNTWCYTTLLLIPLILSIEYCDAMLASTLLLLLPFLPSQYHLAPLMLSRNPHLTSSPFTSSPLSYHRIASSPSLLPSLLSPFPFSSLPFPSLPPSLLAPSQHSVPFLSLSGVAHSRPVHILVATPGRLCELMTDDEIPMFRDMSGLKFLIVDEADRIVEEGHFPEVSQKW